LKILLYNKLFINLGVFDMFELFKKSLMVCTAVSAFGGAGFIGVSSVNSYIDSRVNAVSSSAATSEDATASSAAQLGATIVKKLLK
jgi:hypothetical protein